MKVKTDKIKEIFYYFKFIFSFSRSNTIGNNLQVKIKKMQQ
jgi:hypothetical protein